MASTPAMVCLIVLLLVSGVPSNGLQHSIEEEGVKVDILIKVPERDEQCCYSCGELEFKLYERIYKQLITPASCYEIMKTMAAPPSGYYMIRSSNGSEVRVYCDMTQRRCNSTPGWARVAYLDMTDPTHHCPPAWREIASPKRTCSRTNQTLNGGGCSAAIFPTYGIKYSRVCGRVTAYQFGRPGAFSPYTNTPDISRTINDPYVDGVVITHGQPRNHIWTFACSLFEEGVGNIVCPCTNPKNNYPITIPPWVGQDYFCEAATTTPTRILYPNDPLWDGRGCSTTSTCCEFNNPPWFCKELGEVSSSDIEVRICANQGTASEDTPVELVEIYVQ